jgi:hypothetical protein
MSNFLTVDHVAGSQPKFSDNKYVHVACLSHQWQAKACDLEGGSFWYGLQPFSLLHGTATY